MKPSSAACSCTWSVRTHTCTSKPEVAEVERPRAALVAVPDHRHGRSGDRSEVGVVVVEDRRHEPEGTRIHGVRRRGCAAPRVNHTRRAAATMGDEQLTFAEVDAAANRTARDYAAGVGHGDRAGVVGLDVARRHADLRCVRQARRRVHAGERTARRRRSRGSARVRGEAAVTIVDDAHEALATAFPYTAAGTRLSMYADTYGDDDAVELLRRRARHARRVLHECSTGSLRRARTVSYLRSYRACSRTTPWTVCMFPLFDMARSMTLNVRQMPAPGLLRRARCRLHPLDRRPEGSDPAVLLVRGSCCAVLEQLHPHGVRPLERGGLRHGHVGDAA